MATTIFTPSMLRGAGTRGVPEIPFGSSYENTYSFEFDGTDESVSTGLDCSKDAIPSISVSIWIKIDSSIGWISGYPVGVKSAGSTYNYSSLGLIHGGVIYNKINGSWVWGGGSLKDDTWHNIIWNFDYDVPSAGQTTINIYLDGNTTPVVTGVDLGLSYRGSYLSGDLFIGSLTGTSYYYPAMVDEVSVFDYNVSSANITAIYNLGVPDDLSSLSPVGWWRMGEKATWGGVNWALTDQGSGGNNGTSDNMEEADRKADVPS